MSDTTPERTATSRRTFLKTVGVGVGAAATGGVGLEHATGTADAISIGGALTAGAGLTSGPAIDLAWLLRDFDPFSGDSPPDGLTASALKNRVRDAVAVAELPPRVFPHGCDAPP